MSDIDPNSIRSVLATDCGSTTTKAILIEKNEQGEYRLKTRGEAPTTVEAPVEDVTRGVLNAVREVQELRGRPLLKSSQSGDHPYRGDGEAPEESILRPQSGDAGVDLYISTSSAGGGLQMMVAGVVMNMTAESAARAALGAGAIVMDTIATNDRRLPHEKIERIRQLRPDMILLAGGTDGGTVKHVVALAELLVAAQPRPRLGSGYDLPVIYAGNVEVRKQIRKMLGGKVALQFVNNVRPVLERENLGPARDAIHELFMEHVMAQAPGYSKLMSWADVPIMPTPGAMGLIIKALAERDGVNVVGVDIGGATTDVFSVFHGIFNRTVSANLGMSYSVSNVLAEAGIDNIQRWVAFDLHEAELRDRIGNKMIRPTTIPQTLDELKIEQSIAREALRLAFIQHKQFAVNLAGVQKERTISDAFTQNDEDTLVNMMKLDLLVGSGGVLSHAPRRTQSMLMMIDAFQVEGITELAVELDLHDAAPGRLVDGAPGRRHRGVREGLPDPAGHLRRPGRAAQAVARAVQDRASSQGRAGERDAEGRRHAPPAAGRGRDRDPGHHPRPPRRRRRWARRPRSPRGPRRRLRPGLRRPRSPPAGGAGDRARAGRGRRPLE